MKISLYDPSFWLKVFTMAIYGQAGASTVYVLNNSDLDIHVSSPPALIYVQDAEKNITGADPTKGLDKDGEGTVVQGIPNSFVEQDNIGTDAVNGESLASPYTGWSINILSPASQTFVVNLQGVTTGLCQLWITGLHAAKLKIPKLRHDLEIFVSEGTTRQIQVNFDSSSEALTTALVINPGDFLRDTQSACGLGDIDPAPVCEALESLAAEVEKSITKSDTRIEAEDLEVYLAILNRLHLWGQDSQPNNWNTFKDRPECGDLCRNRLDDKFFITKDVYSALELDAETLLTPIKKQGDHDWRDDHRD